MSKNVPNAAEIGFFCRENQLLLSNLQKKERIEREEEREKTMSLITPANLKCRHNFICVYSSALFLLSFFHRFKN